MSNIYIQEPPCSGKVVLVTTVGDIDIELWSKEAPRACRNFVQLCLENYYDATIFHRVIKGFIAQGGDPNGDGTGGKSIFGAPFKDEFHSRLRFVRRGLVAMANSEKDDNGSQFFFTLGSCPELQNKHTIFGKVTGETLFNMLKLEDCLVDDNDKPLFPHRVISTRVLLNPFCDITPRNKDLSKSSDSTIKPNKKSEKNFKLLSFGEEAEEEEHEMDVVSEKYRGKSKSSHDLANDPKLSSISVQTLYEMDAKDTALQIENIREKLKMPVEAIEKIPTNLVSSKLSVPDDPKENKRKITRKEIEDLMKDLKRRKTENIKMKDSSDYKKKEGELTADTNPMLEDFHKQSVLYKNKYKVNSSNSTQCSKKTLEMLGKFKNKLREASEDEDEDSIEQKEKIHAKNSWFSHELQCDVSVHVAKDANLPSTDRYDITDPRNPINQRRRHEGKNNQKLK